MGTVIWCLTQFCAVRGQSSFPPNLKFCFVFWNSAFLTLSRNKNGTQYHIENELMILLNWRLWIALSAANFLWQSEQYTCSLLSSSFLSILFFSHEWICIIFHLLSCDISYKAIPNRTDLACHNHSYSTSILDQIFSPKIFSRLSVTQTFG